MFCDQVKEDEVDGACSTHMQVRNAYNILADKPEGKRQRGRPSLRW